MATTKTKEEVAAEMDLAAVEAGEELDVIFENQDSIQDLASWLARWYRTAGYNRLSKLVIQKAE